MTDRIVGLDLARTLAIFGMILVNFNIVFNSVKNGNPILISFFHQIEGKAAATFVVLAGIGISLMTRKYTSDNISRNMLVKRGLILWFMGLIFLPIWPADIIHYYGIYLLIAAMLISIKSIKLIYLAISSTFIFVLLGLFIDYETGWDFSNLDYIDLWTINGMIRHLFYNGFHPVFPWVAFIFVGMYIGRLNLNDKSIQTNLFISGVIMVLSVETISRLIINNTSASDVTYLFGTQPLPPFPLFIIIGTGSAFIVISSSIYISNRFVQLRSIKWMIEMGQMSLTNYYLHIIGGMGLLEVLGYDLGKDYISLWFTLLYSIGYFVIMVFFSHFWMSKFSRGPFEALLRRLG